VRLVILGILASGTAVPSATRVSSGFWFAAGAAVRYLPWLLVTIGTDGATFDIR
jgi:hypothetical protein